MKNEKFLLAEAMLAGTGISILDAIRLVRNMLDFRATDCRQTPLQFCGQIIENGKKRICLSEMSVGEGFVLYVQAKGHLRAESLRDIKYLGGRLISANPNFAKMNFSELSVACCEKLLSETFTTPSQFNKGRTMLHGLLEFAIRREWCERNAVRLVERRKVFEKEIKPLSLSEAGRLLKTSQKSKYGDCMAGVAILMLAGVRPREVCRLKWRDVDLSENSITVRSVCSKTGGVRHVEICPALRALLKGCNGEPDSFICPQNWRRRWKRIRDESGFCGAWVQDVLRHTYASYHAKCFKDLPRLQLNMGHRDQALLRSRYVNMSDISLANARKFFTGANN